MTRLGRYAIYQVPGIAVVAAGVWMGCMYAGLPVWGGVALLTAWIVKDVAMYPLVADAYDSSPIGDPARLLGREGIVIQPLGPSGYIKLGGERWRARGYLDTGELPKGTRVRVESVEGLTLHVSVVDAPLDT